MRVYIPLEWSDLPALVRDREVKAPASAYAVTATLRAVADTDDEEELEELARALAADAGVLSGFARPCVLAVDAAADSVSALEGGDAEPGEVMLHATVPFSRIAAVLVSENYVTGAPVPGDEIDLLWFAPQEIEGLLADVTGESAPGE